MKGKAVTLTEEEVQLTLDFVKRMREDKVAHRVTDRMFDRNNTSEGINIIGHLGEMAVGRLLDVPVDMEVRTGGDDGNDMFVGETSVQVKTSELRSLIFNAEHLFKSDIAVLAQFIGKDKKESWKDPRFIIWGWVTKDFFLSNYYKHDFGYGVRLVLDATELNPIDSLLPSHIGAQA
jgi:hypothetical protein